MTPNELSRTALALAADSAAKMERWLTLFESVLSEAESQGSTCDLKEFSMFLTALERALKIAKLAKSISTEEEHGAGARLDTDALRQLLFDED